MRPNSMVMPLVCAAICLMLPAREVQAQVPDPSMSTASVTPGIIRAAWAGQGPALYESLADQGHPITVTIRDAAGDPVPGVDPSRITVDTDPSHELGPLPLAFCVPLIADAPTDASGQTTISGHMEAGDLYFGAPLVVLLDGTPIGSGPLPLDLAIPDRLTWGRIDLLDAWDLHNGITAQMGGSYIPFWDFNRDGVVNTHDYSALRPAMGATCATASLPSIGSDMVATGALYLGAGLNTSINLGVGEFLYVSVYVENSPYRLQAIEFSIPEMEDNPDFAFIGISWEAPAYEYRTDNQSYFQTILSEPLPLSSSIHVATLRYFVQSPVTGVNLTLGGMPDGFSIFDPAPRAAWLSPDEDSNLVHEFATTTGAIINPVTGVSFSGFDHSGLNGAVLTPLSERLEISGLGGVGIPMGGPGGPGGSGSDGAYQEFATDLFGQNLSDGAFLEWSWEDENALPAVQLRGDVSGGAFDMSLDLSGLNSGLPDLVLRAQGQVVEVRPGYSGFWGAPDGLPDTQYLLHRDGELELGQLWGNGTQITLDDQSVHFADEIILRSNTGGTMPRDWLRELRMQGDQLPAIELGHAGLQRFDVALIGAKNLLYHNLEDILFLLVEDPESPAEVTFMSTDGSPARIQGYPPPWPPNATPTLNYRFEDSENPQAPSITLTLSDTGAGVDIDLDLSEQQTNSFQVTALLNGQIVDQYVTSGSFIGNANTWNGARYLTGNEVVMEWPTSTFVDLEPPPGASRRQGLVELDELRFLPLQPLAMPDGLRAVMTMLGTERYAYTGDFVPTTAPQAARGDLALHANVPNPFNPSTELHFTLAADGQVDLSIFDLRGRHVATVVEGLRRAGDGSALWNGRDDSGHAVASGVYHAVLRSQGEIRSRKISLLK